MTIRPSVSLLTIVCFLANTMLSGWFTARYLKEEGKIYKQLAEVRLADATADHPLKGTLVVRDECAQDPVFLIGRFQIEDRVLDLALAVDRDAWLGYPPKGKKFIKKTISQSKDEKGPIFLGIVADKKMVRRLRNGNKSAYGEMAGIIAKWRAGKEVPAWFVTERIEGTLTIKGGGRKRKLSLRVERPGLDGEWGTEDDIVFHASGKVREHHGKFKLWWMIPLYLSSDGIWLATSPIWFPLAWWLFKDGIVF